MAPPPAPRTIYSGPLTMDLLHVVAPPAAVLYLVYLDRGPTTSSGPLREPPPGGVAPLNSIQATANSLHNTLFDKYPHP